MRRFKHNLSFTHSLSLNMGYLVPIGCIDVLPGDSFRHKVSALARVAPLAKPVMHPVQIRIHNWYVPNRILWEDWEEFIVGNEAGHTYPTFNVPGSASNREVLDHMGIEPVVGAEIDRLPFDAYRLIWNEFYRDQDLSAKVPSNDYTLQKIAWGRDYFTTARSNPQQGSAVELSFSAGQAPVRGIGTNVADADYPVNQLIRESGGNTGTYDTDQDVVIAEDPANAGYPNIYADLANATGGIDINDLRNAISLQRISEARQFFGSRYVDYLRWYGINPSDGRLDRPEYLGGGSQTISFSEVLATAENSTSGLLPGEMFGHGIAGIRQRPWRKMFEEHGWLLSLMSVRPAGIYQNGIPRRFSRFEPTDYWHRELELLPWQAISDREIYGAGSLDTVFGYTPRYDEYRETLSYVSGTFRGGTEEDWTMSRAFSSQPTLNESFVECTPTDRIYQDSSQPELLVTTRHNIQARRLVAASARMSNKAGL